MISYYDYIHSPAWRAKRREVIEREQTEQGLETPLCQECHERVGSVVHHLTYARVGNEELDDLALLCRPCHHKGHGWREGAFILPSSSAGVYVRTWSVSTLQMHHKAKQYRRQYYHP